MRWAIVAAFLTSTMFYVRESSAMFDMFRLCVFSAVRGVVLDHGRPVAGAKVMRSFGPPAKPVTDEAVTNEKGEFQLPAVFRTSVIAALLPHQPHIDQTIMITYGGKEFLGWAAAKWDYEENSETGGRPADVVCRLDSEPSKRGEIFGICEPIEPHVQSE
jgi:hypothetical protein